MEKSNSELIRELRAITQAGMKDCKDALEANSWDLQKATDAVKAKGLQNTNSRSGKVTSEGVVKTIYTNAERDSAVMVEVNCQTDFVARSPDFIVFANQVADSLASAINSGEINFAASEFNIDNLQVDGGTTLGDLRKEMIAHTRENIVVRRWWAQQVADPHRAIWQYVHSNDKLGVLVSIEAVTAEALNSTEVKEFADNVAMQIAAMNPLAVSRDNVSQDQFDRQKAIFETQLKDMNKPEAAWPKILEGKLNKWYSEVCLLDQESITTPKTTVGTLAKNLNVKVLSFIRCEVGEGVKNEQKDFAAEVAELSGIEQPTHNSSVLDIIYRPDVTKD